MGFSNSNELFANSNEILGNVETMKKSAGLATQLKISIRAKHAPPANPFATRKLDIRRSSNRQTSALEAYRTTIALQSGLQVEHFWPSASCCTGPLKSP